MLLGKAEACETSFRAAPGTDRAATNGRVNEYPFVLLAEAESERPLPPRIAVRPTHFRPHFGLGRRALDWRVARSAEPSHHPITQGGADVRFTHVRLPWALMFNAFSVTNAASESEAQNDITVLDSGK